MNIPSPPYEPSAFDPATLSPGGDVVTQPKPKGDEPPTVMYLVRSRTGSDSWAEWDDIWPVLLAKVSERAAEQKGNHPGFDVIEVEIQRHAVVRPTVAVEDGAVIGWHDASSVADGTS